MKLQEAQAQGIQCSSHKEGKQTKEGRAQIWECGHHWAETDRSGCCALPERPGTVNPKPRVPPRRGSFQWLLPSHIQESRANQWRISSGFNGTFMNTTYLLVNNNYRRADAPGGSREHSIPFSHALHKQTLFEIKTSLLSTRVFKETWVSVIWAVILIPAVNWKLHRLQGAFTSTNAFNPHNKPLRQIFFLLPFYGWGNWSSGDMECQAQGHRASD